MRSTRLKVAEECLLHPLVLRENYLFHLEHGKKRFVFMDNENHYMIVNNKAEAIMVPSYIVESLTGHARPSKESLRTFLSSIPDVLGLPAKKVAKKKDFPSKKHYRNRVKHFSDVRYYAKKINKFLKLKENFDYQKFLEVE